MSERANDSRLCFERRGSHETLWAEAAAARATDCVGVPGESPDLIAELRRRLVCTTQCWVRLLAAAAPSSELEAEGLDRVLAHDLAVGALRKAELAQLAERALESEQRVVGATWVPWTVTRFRAQDPPGLFLFAHT
jgi:hypothetical protein